MKSGLGARVRRLGIHAAIVIGVCAPNAANANPLSNAAQLSDGSTLVFFTNGQEPVGINAYSSPPDPGGDVYAQKFNSLGTAIGAPFLVNTTTFHAQYNPVILQFSDNSFVVAWSQSQNGNTFAAAYQRFDDSGALSGTEITIATHDDPSNTLTLSPTTGNGFVIDVGRTNESFAVAGQSGVGSTPFASREVIVNDSTFGYYNDGLGTLLDRTGPTGVFPCDNQIFQPSGCGGSVNGPVNESELTAELGVPTINAILGNWLDGDLSAPSWSTAPLSASGIKGIWDVNHEVAVVYEFGTDTESWTELELRIGVDNGVMAWLDGEFIFGYIEEGPPSGLEYEIFPLPNLGRGTHYLQILLEDHGSLVDYTLDFRGTPMATVPEPTTLALIGLGLAGLGFARRRKSH